MKKISLLTGILLSGVTALVIAGCSKKTDPDALKLVEVDPFSLSANHRNLRINGMGYSGEQYTELRKYDEEEQKTKYTYAINEVKALVVPVDFTNHTYEEFGYTEESTRELLNKVIFGGPEYREENGWYSLAEYYKESSFDQCHISGTVAPWFHTGIDSTSINKKNTNFSKDLAIQIQDKYRYSGEGEYVDGINLADYDANKDGFIDSIIMLYTAPITTTGELWWAFCWSVTGAWGKYNDQGTLIGANRFFWASLNFLFEKGNGKYYTPTEIKNGTAKPDAHTMTHEYGHVLSLPDYYVTDYSSSDYSGLGGLDMMDYNIGDHNAFSKMLYGWLNPRRVDGLHGSVTTKLKSTTTTGDAIIIPAPGDWNNTYLDQYLLVEFLTPEGVAKKDGEAPYLGTYPLYYSKAGVRITQVDARMGKWDSNSGKFAGYTWSTSRETGSYVSFAADNTASDSAYPAYKLIELLPADGKTMKARGGNAGDDCLYLEGDVFGANGVFEDFKLNGISGQKDKDFGFKISVDAIDGFDSATITISL